MENANSYEYLEKIKIAVIENLKRTAPVPSVQMQDVPRQGLGMTDEDDAELDDMDEDENKDVRMTQRQWEKSIARQEEFEESDDEEMAAANGVYTGGRTRRSILDYRNPHAADMDIDSGVATPTRNGEENGVSATDKDETMDDAEPEKPQSEETADKEAQPEAEAEKKVDEDGDVDMAEDSEAAKPTADAEIKKEEVEATAEPEKAKTKSPEVEGAAGASEPGEDHKEAPSEPASEKTLGKESEKTEPAENPEAEKTGSEKDVAASEETKTS